MGGLVLIRSVFGEETRTMVKGNVGAGAPRDLCIIGSGPGGYVSALRARQLGFSVTVVEREALGGVCLNWGCIPTKALLKSAEMFYKMRHCEKFGITAPHVSFSLEAMVKRSREVTKKLSSGIDHLLKKAGVDVVFGSASLSPRENDSFRVEVALNDTSSKSKEPQPSLNAKKIIQARRVLIATGASPRVIPGLTPDGLNVWSHRDALVATRVPERMLVIGAGAIGIEFASFFNMLGSHVTVLEARERILPMEDADVVAVLRKSLEARGIAFIVDHMYHESSIKDGRAEVLLKGKNQELVRWSGDVVLLAIGVSGNSSGIGLEHTRVALDGSQIRVDAHHQTDEPGLYAIGDVTGVPWLAHKASHEGVLCVEHMYQQDQNHTPPHKMRNEHLLSHEDDRDTIPGCIYSYPQIASIGMSEEEAIRRGKKIRIGTFPLAANGQALAQDEPEGLVKTLWDAETGELLGAHMVGAGVSEMIQGFSIAKKLEATAEAFVQTIFPHPSISETMHESALSALGKALHI